MRPVRRASEDDVGREALVEWVVGIASAKYKRYSMWMEDLGYGAYVYVCFLLFLTQRGGVSMFYYERRLKGKRPIPSSPPAVMPTPHPFSNVATSYSSSLATWGQRFRYSDR
jgi:hypothetical protein